MAKLELKSFYIEQKSLNEMRKIKARTGIPQSEQVRRAISAYLQAMSEVKLEAAT